MRRLLFLTPVSALAAVVLAACGSSSNNATIPSLGGTHTRQSASSGSLTASRALVACARRHGMPSIPDPVVGSNGQITVPGYATTADLTPAVRSACATQIQAIGGSASGNPIESTSDIQALLRVAACMRTHGFPHWPDPNNRGEFHVKSADAGTPATEKRAITACNSLFPPSGWHLIVNPSGQ